MGEPRNPLAIYLLALTFVSGIGTSVGVPTSGSIEAELPIYLARAWGLMLLFGSSSSLLGIFWMGDVRTGLLLKRTGMLSLTVAAGVYGTVLLVAARLDAGYVAGIIYGFGVATAIQFVKVNRRIRKIIEASQ